MATKKTKRKAPAKKKARSKGGRPTKYTKALANKICTRLAEGESLRSICRDSGTPSKSTLLLWVVTPGHPFSDQYMIAREAAGYSHADKVTEIADALSEKGSKSDPQKARVAMIGYQWAAERMAPKKHSPKHIMEHSGPNGGPIEINDAKTKLASKLSGK